MLSTNCHCLTADKAFRVEVVNVDANTCIGLCQKIAFNRVVQCLFLLIYQLESLPTFGQKASNFVKILFA